MQDKIESYYRDNLPRVIEKLKVMVDKNLEIVDMHVDKKKLSDDRYVNVLKARRMAVEDAVYAMREIDKFERELNGESVDLEKAENANVSWAKKMAHKRG